MFGGSKRKSPPPSQPSPPDRRGWNEDWRVGDLAVCVRDDWERQKISPKVGEVLRVSGLYEDVVTSGVDKGCLASGLCFEGRPQHFAWRCSGFRKVRPDHRADEVETGIIAKIKGVRHDA